MRKENLFPEIFNKNIKCKTFQGVVLKGAVPFVFKINVDMKMFLLYNNISLGKERL